MILISIIITIAYLLLIGSFVFGFNKVERFKLKNIKAETKFSIIIPFRNEVEHLPELLKSIHSLEYPTHLFEIILVDDESEDDSVDLIMRFLTSVRNDIKLLSNVRTSNSPKKDAISTAIKQAKNNWIVTTDADCILPKYWLDCFDEFIQTNPCKCIAAPVTYSIKNTFLQLFQLLDILSLQGVTIGAFGINNPFLNNGANFAYSKELFGELNGFKGNTNIASGDDIFLLEKAVKKYPKDVHYLKCEQAIVKTKPQSTWKDLSAQRMRWAAKTSAYKSWFSKLTGLLVLLMNSLVITLLLLTIAGSFNIKILCYIVFIKFNIDFYSIYKSASFFNQKEVLRTYIFGFLFYPFFSVFIAVISLFSGYKWKDRRFKK